MRELTSFDPLPGKQVFLRPFTLADISAEYIAWLNDPRVVRYSNQRFLTHTRESCRLDLPLLGLSRDRICDALVAEGVNISRSYQNIHLLPLYQKKIAFGTHGFPWSSDICHRDVDYGKGICPVAERLNDSDYIGFGMCTYDLDAENVRNIADAFHKVWANMDSLR